MYPWWLGPLILLGCAVAVFLLESPRLWAMWREREPKDSVVRHRHRK